METIQSYWFVGASWDDADQTDRFVQQGVWENGYDDKYVEQVNAIKPGDLIAIKAAYTRKSGVPFETRGNVVSTMAIKAIGRVTKNYKNGKKLDVEWQSASQTPREWYFYTNMKTIWHIQPGDWKTDGLIAFAFEEQPQDIDKFRNAPFWRERFGDIPEDDIRFKWASFYEAVASSLLKFEHDRQKLIDISISVADKHGLSYMQDKHTQLDDMDPFTLMGMFNRGQTAANRQAIAADIATAIGVEAEIPTSFEAIPLLNNQKSWFFWGKEDGRGEQDVNNLWALFKIALMYADDNEKVNSDTFVEAYDKVIQQKGIRWNITMGLFWIRPWFYPTLETQSMDYLGALSCKPDCSGPKRTCSGEEYLVLRENLLIRFSEDTFPVHSFPELSLNAFSRDVKPDKKSSHSWKLVVIERIRDLCHRNQRPNFSRQEFQENYLDEISTIFPENSTPDMSIDRTTQQLRDEGEIEFISSGQYRWVGYEDDTVLEETAPVVIEKRIEAYDLSNIKKDGCFIEVSELEGILSTLRDKKNMILQGPPGTGKTWLAKRLAMALIGEKQPEQIKAVQFHPNLAYEDFIRGWRPSGHGQLTLCDGPFLEWVHNAQKYPSKKFIVVIEEINRGNPAQIFGEMLTLLEADKRTPEEALHLSYTKEDDEPVYIPSNLYVIGTMNVADRSLALVDLALRRRFAFVSLKPLYDDNWRNWVHEKKGISTETLNVIQHHMRELNNAISDDSRLGEQFQIGHSYFTPAKGHEVANEKKWYQQVVRTEIAPLLDEYWYDDPETAMKYVDELMSAL